MRKSPNLTGHACLSILQRDSLRKDYQGTKRPFNQRKRGYRKTQQWEPQARQILVFNRINYNTIYGGMWQVSAFVLGEIPLSVLQWGQVHVARNPFCF